MSAGALIWCKMVQSRPVATLATVICDRNNAIAGKERERDRSDGSTARAAVGLQATGPEAKMWATGPELRARGVRPTAKSRLSSDCNFQDRGASGPRDAQVKLSRHRPCRRRTWHSTQKQLRRARTACQRIGFPLDQQGSGPPRPLMCYCGTDITVPGVLSYPLPTCCGRTVEGPEIEGAVPRAEVGCGSLDWGNNRQVI